MLNNVPIFVVRPLFKKSTLDISVFNNYRPVSNSSCLAKIMGKSSFDLALGLLTRMSLYPTYLVGI